MSYLCRMSNQPLMDKADLEGGGPNEFDANLTSTGLNKEDEIAKAKMTDVAAGLSHEEAARRLQQYGLSSCTSCDTSLNTMVLQARMCWRRAVGMSA